jgi:hypothetical protein
MWHLIICECSFQAMHNNLQKCSVLLAVQTFLISNKTTKVNASILNTTSLKYAASVRLKFHVILTLALDNIMVLSLGRVAKHHSRQ